MSWLTTNETMPAIQLVGFQQLFIESQASQEFQFVISAEQMAVWTNSGFTVQAGATNSVFNISKEISITFS
jgi:hypothetical protein